MNARNPSSWLSLYVALAVLFLVLPILVVVPSAFGSGSTLDFPPRGISLKWFANVLQQQDFIPGFLLSVRLGLAATAVSVVLGAGAAYGLVRYEFRGKNVLMVLFLSPLVFPGIVVAVALTVLLSSVGLLGGFLGLLFAHVLVTLPYAIRTIASGLHEISIELEEAARTLGAPTRVMVWSVLFPLLRPSLLAAGAFCFITSFDEFVVSLFLTRPGLITLPIALYTYTDFNLDPTVAALSTLLLLFTAAFIFIGDKAFGLGKHFKT